MHFLHKFKFKSSKKNKLNLIKDKNEFINYESINGAHIEFFSNKRVIVEGCYNIVDYQENYIKLKLKKGFISFTGSDFLISFFNEEKIDIKGNVMEIEFCV